MMRFADKVALVTGGGSGIGRATALRLAREGARVAVADMNLVQAEAVAAECGNDSFGVQVNVADWAAADACVKAVVERAGRLDILINNAGINRDSMVHKMTEEQWDSVLDVNLKGTFNMARAALVPMSAQKYGRIVNTASIGVKGNMGQANYAASKAGVIGLTRTLCLEYARHNITVNCVSPGATETTMTAGMPDKVREAIVGRIPLRRMADPAEVAALHAFLASDDAGYVTGQVVYCDGGITTGLM